MPTNTPIPSATPGTVIPSATQNDMAVLNAAVGLYGVGATLAGSAPPVTAPNFLIQAGTSVVTTSGGAVATVSFPSAFPNGVLTILVSAGDNASSFSQMQLLKGSVTTSLFTGYAYTQAGTAITSSSIRINWLAIGF